MELNVMAKPQVVKPAKSANSESILEGLFAGKYNSGERGKMKRPEGITDAHWQTFNANRRVAQAVKVLKGVQRMAGYESLTSEQKAQILAIIRERYLAIKSAFENPETKVKVREGRLF